MAIFSIRNFAIKQLMKLGDDGIMKMPSNMKADFAEAMLTKQLMDFGIDPKIIKNEQQMINVLDGIDNMKKQMAETATKEKTGITSAKIMDMEGKEIPPGSTIMGGKGLDNIFDEMYGDFQKDKLKFMSGKTKETEAEIAKRMKKENKEAVERFKKKMDEDPEEKADGGRIGLKGGADMGTVSTPTRRATARSVNVSPSGSVTTSRNRGPDPVDDRGNTQQNINQRNVVNSIVQPKESILKNLYNTGQDINYLRNLMIGNFPGIGKQLLLDLGKKKFLDNQTMLNDDEEGIVNGLPESNLLAFEPGSPKDKKLQSLFKEKGLAEDIGIPFPPKKEKQLQELMKEDQEQTDFPKTPLLKAKDGGRIGLKNGMDRRTFLKIMGGLASIPIVGKLFKGAKVASKAAPVVSNVTKSEAPAYFFDLVTKIKAFGKQSKTGPSEMMNEYSYIGKNGDQYTLTEDIVSGDAQIIKDKMGVGSYGDKTFDTINDRSIMEYKAPKKDADPETKTFIDEGAEYDEYKVEFDMDGTEAGADVIEETIQKEIIEEAKKSAPPIKKASGGLAYMLGE
tara:strand:+ start:55 stop:1746 length:1692 start_codon:yes stop_codon:yes gene_type:complete